MKKLSIVLILLLLVSVTAVFGLRDFYDDMTGRGIYGLENLTHVNSTQFCLYGDDICITTWAQVNGSSAAGGKEGDGIYLYNDSDTMYFNETKLNTTIDARENDTTYTAGQGLTLTGTELNHTDTSSQATVTNSYMTFIKNVQLDTYGHITALTSGIIDQALNTSSSPTFAKVSSGDWSNVSITESQVSDADWWDADGDVAADEISESKIAFSTACAAGNHYYLSGNDLACEADDDTTYTAGGTYLYLSSTTFWLNETKLNATITTITDARDSDTTYNSDEIYITEATNVFSLDETKLNATIDARDSDTTYDNTTPITLTGTTFGLTTCSDNEILKMDGAAWNCEADAAGGAGSGAWDISTSNYLYNNSNVLDLNETHLNATIAALDTDTDTTYNSDEVYITEAANVFSIDETKLNATIVANDAILTAGDALTLTGTDIDFDGGATPGGELGGTWASPTVDSGIHDDEYIELGDSFAGDVSGTYDAISIDCSAVVGDGLNCDGENLVFECSDIAGTGLSCFDSNMILSLTPTITTLNTGQGAYELYSMNQDVESTDAVTFATIDTGYGANELYDMDQNVLTSSDVTFADVTATTFIGNINRSYVVNNWAFCPAGSAQYGENESGRYCDSTFLNSTDTAALATALAANGANCVAGSYPLGVDASGAVEDCTDATTEINTEIANVLDGTDVFTDFNGNDVIDSDNYATDSIDNEHINWADIDNLGDEGAVTLASTATALATARAIGGVNFDGTAAITPTTIVVADTADATSFVGLWTAATGSLLPKSDGALLYDASTGRLDAPTLNTGQGDNNLYDMDQNVLEASAVVFATVDTGEGANELFNMNQDVESTDAVTFITLDTGYGANELWDMDQHVLTTSDVTFVDVTATNFNMSVDSANHRMYDNATCVIITGDTATLEIC